MTEPPEIAGAGKPARSGPADEDAPRGGLSPAVWMPVLTIALAGLVVLIGYRTIAA